MVFQFIFSHCGVARNEEADRAADGAVKDPRSINAQDKCGIPLRAVKAQLKLSIRDLWLNTHDEGSHRSIISKKATNLRRSAEMSRGNEVLLHQLRTGECRLAGKFRKRMALPGSEICRWCLREEETINHMFSACIGLVKLRRELSIMDSTILCADGERILIFFHSALEELHAGSGETLEEKARYEEIEDAIIAGAITVRRR